MVWLSVLGIFNVRTDVDARNCTRFGGDRAKRERELKLENFILQGLREREREREGRVGWW